ncbi:hypothetical protein FRC20_008538 [Serendipita sp. 405]|nr:hypothetical protein FRC16_008144 [Serendipita sp. 398]KAG8829903.1 hypothetical protein FRC20_008538 [Serendipita sp. 405]
MLGDAKLRGSPRRSILFNEKKNPAFWAVYLPNASAGANSARSLSRFCSSNSVFAQLTTLRTSSKLLATPNEILTTPADSSIISPTDLNPTPFSVHCIDGLAAVAGNEDKRSILACVSFPRNAAAPPGLHTHPVLNEIPAREARWETCARGINAPEEV